MDAYMFDQSQPELTDRQKAFVLWLCGLSLSEIVTLRMLVSTVDAHWGPHREYMAQAVWEVIRERECEVPTPPDVLAFVVKG